MVRKYMPSSVQVCISCFFFFQAEDGIRDTSVTGVQTCALPISGGARRAGPLDRGGGGVASHAREHLRPPSGRLDGECDHALVLRRREGRGFSRGSARDEQSDPSRDLPLDERAQPRLVHVAGGVERGDEGRPATAQPLQMLAHRTFLSLPGSGSSARMSSSTSAKAYTPRRPTIQRAASSAPAATPARASPSCLPPTAPLPRRRLPRGPVRRRAWKNRRPPCGWGGAAERRRRWPT